MVFTGQCKHESHRHLPTRLPRTSKQTRRIPRSHQSSQLLIYINVHATLYHCALCIVIECRLNDFPSKLKFQPHSRPEPTLGPCFSARAHSQSSHPHPHIPYPIFAAQHIHSTSHRPVRPCSSPYLCPHAHRKDGRASLRDRNVVCSHVGSGRLGNGEGDPRREAIQGGKG